jgi:hypothetical protein
MAKTQTHDFMPTVSVEQKQPSSINSETSLNHLQTINVDCNNEYYHLSFDISDESSSQGTAAATIDEHSDTQLLERYVSFIVEKNLSRMQRHGLTDSQMADLIVDTITSESGEKRATRSMHEFGDGGDVCEVRQSRSDTQISNKNTK